MKCFKKMQKNHVSHQEDSLDSDGMQQVFNINNKKTGYKKYHGWLKHRWVLSRYYEIT